MNLDHGIQNYVGWKATSVTRIKEKYGYRIILQYSDGSSKTQQKSGFPTEKKAQADRDRTIASLYNGTYIVYENVKVGEFLEYWLNNELYERTESNNTLYNYEGVIKNHIVPRIGSKRVAELTKGDIQRLYNDVAAKYRSSAEQVRAIMNVSMKCAVNMKVISTNPAEGVRLPKEKKKAVRGYHERAIDTRKTLNLDQIYLLLEKSKDTPIHMQVLFNVLMGLRRSEIIGLKYDDVDYINRTLTVRRQLGKVKGGKKEDFLPKTLIKQEIGLKTESSYREIPIPDYVFEAILRERATYERNQRRRGKYFQDLGFICCSTYGRPRSRDFHWKYYKKLLADNGLPDIRWHDLRATFSTLLLKNDINPKAVAKLMGHAKEIVTLDVYADKQSIIADGIPEIEAYMDEVMPRRNDKGGLMTICWELLLIRHSILTEGSLYTFGLGCGIHTRAGSV